MLKKNVTSIKRNVREIEWKKKKKKKIWNANARFPYSSPRLLFGETIDTASRNVEGGKKEKKFLSIASR